jgi:hypothetical protein
MKQLIGRVELGRASWKLFHTILSRFPERPTLDEREALNSYIHLFARLYPCGEWYVTVTCMTLISALNIFKLYLLLIHHNRPQEKQLRSGDVTFTIKSTSHSIR